MIEHGILDLNSSYKHTSEHRWENCIEAHNLNYQFYVFNIDLYMYIWVSVGVLPHVWVPSEVKGSTRILGAG